MLDSSGAVLPGVTLTLSSAQGGTLGGTQETVSDARGNYQFIRLVPGTYAVRARCRASAPSNSATSSSTPMPRRARMW